MDTIKEIIDPSFRSGTGKTGKPWTMMKIRTESGKEASGFAPLAVGDSVILKYNDQYKNYSAELATGSKIENLKKDELLEGIDKKLDRILVLLDGKLTKPVTPAIRTGGPAYPAQPSVELPPVDQLEDELDLSSIPF